MADDLNDLIQGFVEESHEAFDDIEKDLLTIETNPDDLSIVNGIFRVMHTIKGTAGFLNLDDIGKLSHKIESIFDMIRREELKITSDIMDTILPSIDLLKLMVFELLEEKKSNYDLGTTLEILQKLTYSTAEEVDEGIPKKKKKTSHIKLQQDVEGDDQLEEFKSILASTAPQLKSDFVVEAEEHLETIEENLLILEQNPEDSNSINEVFRAIHSIKGTSDYVNLNTITKISHNLETIFDQIRKGIQDYDNDLADVVLKGVDILRTLVFMLKSDDTSMVIKIDDVVRQLEKLIIPKKKTPENRSPKKSVATNTIDAFNNISSQQIIVLEHLGKIFTEKALDAGEIAVLYRSIKTLRDGAKKIGFSTVVSLSSKLEKIINSVMSETVSIEKVSTEFSELNNKLIIEIQTLNESANTSFDQTNKGFKIDPDSLIDTGENQTLEVKQQQEEIIAQSVSKDNIIKTMRVDSSRLDMFMNLIGELIIIRNSYSHTLSELAEQKIPNDILQELKTMESNFNRLSDGLHATLMDIRLIPVKTVFQKIPRIIRDISRKKDKNIQFQMIGENTEIDKSIIEMIGDPLVHIVRNCCDHGIESIETRKKEGKPEVGNIILRASHLGSAIAIDIIDDGAGIDTEKVLKLAIEKGMVSKDKAKTLDDKAIYSFIFQPGFSTADEITDISGRGVGMDVVITNIKKVHGTVDIESDKGHGTQVRLLLPLTLAVVDALLFIDNKQKYAIPLEAVKETIEIREKELQQLKKKEAINLRGDIIGVSRLSTLLDMESKPSDPEKVLSIVFLQSGQRIIGIVVDDLANQQEIVVKPLQRYLTNIPGISGSTILGNGEIILILDPSELIDLASL